MRHCSSLLLSHTKIRGAIFHGFCSLSDAPTCGWFTQALANEDATALAKLLGTVSMQHDTYLPWWRQNNASSIKQPSRSKTTASDDNASDISEIPRDNDYPKKFCGSSYFQLGRKYHGPHVEDFSTHVAALIAHGKPALKNLRIQDGECAFECATRSSQLFDLRLIGFVFVNMAGFTCLDCTRVIHIKPFSCYYCCLLITQ